MIRMSASGKEEAYMAHLQEEKSLGQIRLDVEVDLPSLHE